MFLMGFCSQDLIFWGVYETIKRITHLLQFLKGDMISSQYIKIEILSNDLAYWCIP